MKERIKKLIGSQTEEIRNYQKLEKSEKKRTESCETRKIADYKRLPNID